MYEGKNLLEHHSSSSSKYITELMPKIFTRTEMAEGLIKDSNSVSNRKALDIAKVAILKGIYAL
jgi:hypothetical protein